MTGVDRLEQVRSSKTARVKAREPRVGEIRFDARRDAYFGAQTRLAEAFARRDPWEPDPVNRAKSHMAGLFNSFFFAVSEAGEDEAADDFLLGVARAGVGANVTQEPEDREVLAIAFRDACRRIFALDGDDGEPPCR